MTMPAEFNWQSCCQRILADLDNLCEEVDRLDKIFVETQFLGTEQNFPNAHFGILMVCMAKVDFLSQCMIPGPGSQSHRMLAYLNKYVAPGKATENAVILQMFRHTLMHTGELRFLHWPSQNAVYTWRVYWSEATGGDRHYAISEVDSGHQSQILAVHSIVQGASCDPKTMCLHWVITSFANDIRRSAKQFLTEGANSPEMQSNVVTAYRCAAMQQVKD